MPTPLRIDFVSDVACPWCLIGLRSLLRGLEALGDEIAAEIHFQPFELNPNMPPEGENAFEHVQRKYGSTRERSDEVREVIRQHGEALGFTFRYSPDSRIWNTFDAHRLLHWAAEEGRQLELKQALFASYFELQMPTNDPVALADAAASVGLDRNRAEAILASGAYAEEVRRAEAFWTGQGIQAVPSIVFNGRWMVQGGQPPETFVNAIRQVVAAPAQA